MNHLEFIDTQISKGVYINKNTCELQINSPMGSSSHVLVVNPLSVKCDSLRHDYEAEQEAITWAIDFDKWQHSWHHEIKPENYSHFLEIIQGKVIEKSEQLVQLNAVAIFLANKIKEIEVTNPGSLVKHTAIDDSDWLPF